MRIPKKHALRALGLGLLLALSPAMASAQHDAQLAKPHVEAMTKKARELYAEGVLAFGQRRWADARAAFVGAWALHPHFTIAGNLGAAELELGLYRDATEHLSLYARELARDAEATAKERQDAGAMVAKARSRVAALVVRVPVDGAEIFVDGERVGAAPLADPIFVEPGAHTVEVRAEGFRAGRAAVQAAAGSEHEVAPTLRAIPEAVAGAAAGSPARRAPGPNVGEQPPARAAGGPRKELLLAGSAVAGAAAVAGVVFTVVANGKASDAEDQAAALASTGTLCPREGASGACLELQDTLSARDGFSSAAVWSFIGAGALGAATVIYAFAAPRHSPGIAFRAAPAAGPRSGGLMIDGRF